MCSACAQPSRCILGSTIEVVQFIDVFREVPHVGVVVGAPFVWRPEFIMRTNTEMDAHISSECSTSRCWQ